MEHQTRGLPQCIVGLDIVVATNRDEDGEFLIRNLQYTRSRVRHIWPIPSLLPEDTDVMFCDFIPGLPNRIPWVPGAAKGALVVIIPVTTPLDLELLMNCAADAVLHRPFTHGAIIASLLQGRTRFTYEERLRSRIDKLDDTLRAMRVVERAKAILIDTRKMQEAEAYHFIRKQAMDRRVPVSTVAASIIDSFELLK